MNLICTSCPVGCRMTIIEDKKGNIEVTGNACKRGEKYAFDEYSNPKRMVTSSIFIDGGNNALVSVKTDKPIKKELVKEVFCLIKKMRVKAPIDIGDIIIRNVTGTDVNIVATRKVTSV